MSAGDPSRAWRRGWPAGPRALVAMGWTIALAAVTVGCAPRITAPPPAPPPVPPIARPAPGYEARTDSLDAVRLSALAGRRIVLDPGHGGFFPGSVGVHGLTEAAVNLGVALELRDLLQAHGAQVLLTRETDRDFLTRADSSLRADLAERVRIAEGFAPDLFVSIHHNADAGGAHDRNEIQTYYKLGDEGPSLDAAQSLHRYLKRNLGIDRHRILPGNYYVLRNGSAPGVLTEASYLTNPDVEARLALPEKRRLEAEALLLGLAHYFARRVPVIATLAASPAPSAGDADAAIWRGPSLDARIQGEFDHVELTIDGAPVRAVRAGDRLRWSPDLPLAAGVHRARLAVALTGQGSARERSVEFVVRRPVRRIWTESYPDRLPQRGGPVAIRARLVDAYGLPVLDSMRVRMKVASGGRPLDTLLVARDGVAWGYARMRRDPKAERSVTVALADARFGRAPSVGVRIRSLPLPGVATAFLRAVPGDSAVRPVVFRSDSTGTPALSWVTPHGFAPFALDSAGRARAPALPGWRPLALPDSAPAPAVPVRWTAIAGGTLHGRRIALDPDGGGDDAAGMGASGTRASLYNLEVARALAGLLEAAGAEVRLVRTADAA
ncbi:MAG TPA: N-acetylmuramoyl-L-alanine amidase, partial [Candidatus Limnocylindria bacterium]|nr:N-acetylmuramoyl-L-alanine amidase [Candidatus Limnocylindria bacterium]